MRFVSGREADVTLVDEQKRIMPPCQLTLILGVYEGNGVDLKCRIDFAEEKLLKRRKTGMRRRDDSAALVLIELKSMKANSPNGSRVAPDRVQQRRNFLIRVALTLVT